jgi:hypothetical protein
MLAPLALALVLQGNADPELARMNAEADAMRARVAMQPRAVRDFVARRAMCNHWLGEEPYDRERRREIESAVRDLGCATIDGEDAFLRRHFAARPEIRAILDETRDIPGW